VPRDILYDIAHISQPFVPFVHY